MNLLDFAVMSTEGLRERRFRFALNLVGILIGCAAVTGLISMSQGMKTSIVDDISIFGATTIQVYPTLGGDEAFTSLDWRDLNRLRGIAGVEAAAPVQAGGYGRYDYRGMTYSNEVVGVDENYFIVHGGENEVEDGRLLTHSDGAAALLGYNIWNPDDEAMYGVGDRLRIRSTVDGEEIEFTVRVVGILKKTSGITGSGVDDYIILHLDYFEQVFDTQGKYLAVDENYFIVHGGENEVEDGRLLTHSDGAAALLGYNIWNPDDEAMYGVGDRLRIRSTVDGEEIEFTVRVVGILKKTSGITGSGVDDYIILHLDYFEQVFDTQGKYLAVDLKAETIDDIEGIKQAIEEDFDNLGYYSMDMIMEEVNMITGTVNAVLGGIAGISLLVAGVTIANTMTVSVMERTKEIGTMKAIGATNRDVLLLFISESMVTGMVGGGLGAGLGFVLSMVIGRVINLAPEPSMSLGLMVTGFAVATCVVSGIYPAWRASNLNPVEALRDE